MRQITILEIHGQTKLAAVPKFQTQHFAFFKLNVAQSRLMEFYQTKVAPAEFGFREFNFAEIGIGKVAVDERAVFVFAFWQRVLGKVDFVKSLVFSIHCIHTQRYQIIEVSL